MPNDFVACNYEGSGHHFAQSRTCICFLAGPSGSPVHTYTARCTVSSCSVVIPSLQYDRSDWCSGALCAATLYRREYHGQSDLQHDCSWLKRLNAPSPRLYIQKESEVNRLILMCLPWSSGVLSLRQGLRPYLRRGCIPLRIDGVSLSLLGDGSAANTELLTFPYAPLNAISACVRTPLFHLGQLL